MHTRQFKLPTYADDGREVLPGTRLADDGGVWVFDFNLQLDYLAAKALWNCPADLSGLSDDELSGLRFDCIRFNAMNRDNRLCEALLVRIADEKRRRSALSTPAKEAA
jgi:hypothetical protein